MKQSIERMAKTVELAIEEALAELGASEDEVIIEVLDEGEAGGLLGFGRRPARVRLSLESAMEFSDEADGSDAFSDLDWQAEEESKSERLPDQVKSESEEASGEAFFSDDESRHERGAPLSSEEMTAAEDRAVDFIATVLQSLGIHGKISSYFDDEGSLRVDVSGQDIGNAIGRRGETLEALQYLATLAVNRKSEPYVRLVLDIGRYRERRMRNLRQQAQRNAGRVLRSGRRFTMEAMSPSERRQIHMALADYKGITTYSEGEEPHRCVVIAPENEH